MEALRFASCIAFILIAKSFAIDEPICSKFDYEEKLLAKMIRMEIEMERMKLDMEANIETRIDQAIENLTLSETPEVAFSAYNPSLLNFGDGHTIVYQSTLMNTESGYDTNTGIFTAPTSGLYLFTVHTCSVPNQHAVVAIVHENTRLAIDTQYASASSCGSVSALHHVTQGETVHIESAYVNTKMQTDQWRRNSFLGVLLYVDRLDTSSQQLGPIA